MQTARRCKNVRSRCPQRGVTVFSPPKRMSSDSEQAGHSSTWTVEACAMIAFSCCCCSPPECCCSPALSSGRASWEAYEEPAELDEFEPECSNPLNPLPVCALEKDSFEGVRWCDRREVANRVESRGRDKEGNSKLKLSTFFRCRLSVERIVWEVGRFEFIVLSWGRTGGLAECRNAELLLLDDRRIGLPLVRLLVPRRETYVSRKQKTNGRRETGHGAKKERTKKLAVRRYFFCSPRLLARHATAPLA